MSTPIASVCTNCGFEWLEGDSGAHNCETHLRLQREDLQLNCEAMKRRAEGAEKRQKAQIALYQDAEREIEALKGKLADSRDARDRDNDAHAKDIAELQKHNAILYGLNEKQAAIIASLIQQRDILPRPSQQIEELTRQRDMFRAENESRAHWIGKMNAILGYDNSDGRHSSPTPHEIAQRMKDDLTHAFNSPGAGKNPLVNDPNALSRAELEKQLADAHTVLDNDPSKIIRNAKDGYPEGREPHELTIAERVQALCKYASDHVKWLKDTEKERDEANERWMLQSNAAENQEADRLRQLLEAARNILDLAE